MSAPPIPCVFRDRAFHPLPNFHNVASAHYGEGEIASLVRHEERSQKSHAHYFACVGEAWKSLPEEKTEQFPTADHLRKWALIKAGYRDERTFVCSSKAEAQRIAAFMRPMDTYAIVLVREAVLTAYTAKSQSEKAMGKAEFQDSKTKVLEIIADLISVTPETLARQAA